MKLIQYGEPGREKCGVWENGEIYSAVDYFDVYDEYFFESDGIEQLKSHLQAGNLRIANPHSKDAKTVRIGAPVGRPSKIVCIGLNYLDHALETGIPVPAEPIIFLKATSAMTGPFDRVVIPKNSFKTDWEVELAVVIGKKASYVEESEAMNYIAGYCLHNDVSERAFQLERGGQWDKGKGCDSFAPLGPWLVTPDEIPDPDNLNLHLSVNGEVMQNSNTKHLIFKIPYLIHYVSQFMTLLPGDVISTGTPPGVGMGMHPPRYLKSGDVMELSINGLGSARQVCVDR